MLNLFGGLKVLEIDKGFREGFPEGQSLESGKKGNSSRDKAVKRIPHKSATRAEQPNPQNTEPGLAETPLPDSFYLQFMSPEQALQFAEILRSPELLKLDTEIARMKTLAGALDTGDTSEKNVKLLIGVHDLIGRLVATRHKMLYGEKHSLNIRSVQVVMKQVVRVIEKNVLSPEVRQRIARDLKKISVEG